LFYRQTIFGLGRRVKKKFRINSEKDALVQTASGETDVEQYATICPGIHTRFYALGEADFLPETRDI
jgi:hypothetical protein